MEDEKTGEVVIVADTPTAMVSSQVNTYNKMIEKAVDGSLDVGVIERLVALRKEVREEEAKHAFEEAMSRFKSMCPPVLDRNRKVSYLAKGRNVEFTWTTHDKMMSVVTPHLVACGLNVRWRHAQSSGSIEVTCVVSHAMGHSEESKLNAPRDGDMSKGYQGVAATVTALERRTMMSVLGLSSATLPDADSSDNAGSKRQSGPTKEQVEQLQRLSTDDLLTKVQVAEVKQALTWVKQRKPVNVQPVIDKMLSALEAQAPGGCDADD